MHALGIFGGSFDPVHFGHLRSAIELTEVCQLSELKLMPCRVSPTRPTPFASDQQRLQMLRLAINEQPCLQIDDRELRRPAPSYSVDSLAAVRAEQATQSLVFVLGQDAFNHLQQWHEWQRLCELTHLLVLQRPGAQRNTNLFGFVETNSITDLHNKQSGLLYRYSPTQMDISSTRIRDLIQNNRSIRGLVPLAVENYIQQHFLYRGTKN